MFHTHSLRMNIRGGRRQCGRMSRLFTAKVRISVHWVMTSGTRQQVNSDETAAITSNVPQIKQNPGQDEKSHFQIEEHLSCWAEAWRQTGCVWEKLSNAKCGDKELWSGEARVCSPQKKHCINLCDKPDFLRKLQCHFLEMSNYLPQKCTLHFYWPETLDQSFLF